MSAPSGSHVAGGDFASAPRWNRMLIHYWTGAEMVTPPIPKYDGMTVWCTQTETGSGFTRGFLYNWDNQLGQYRTSSGGKHLHDADTDTAGGLFADIWRANLNKAFPIDLATTSTGDYHISKSGSGAESNDATGGRVLLTTGSTSASYVHATRSGLAFDLAKPIDFGFKGFVSHGSRITVKLGICMENVNASSDDLSKLGLEACDSAGTAKQWDVVSATGAVGSRSINVSSENVLQASPRFYKLVFTPGTSLTYAINGGAPAVTKLSNIPGSGRTSHIGVFSGGIKTNEAVSKTMNLYATRVMGSISDTGWF